MYDGVRGVYPRASTLLHDQRIKVQAGINQEFQMHTEAILLASKILSKCEVFWGQMAAEVESFHLNFVTATYGEVVLSAGRAECWTGLLTMMKVICR